MQPAFILEFTLWLTRRLELQQFLIGVEQWDAYADNHIRGGMGFKVWYALLFYLL